MSGSTDALALNAERSIPAKIPVGVADTNSKAQRTTENTFFICDIKNPSFLLFTVFYLINIILTFQRLL